MKSLPTKKLFFRKYPYKVELRCDGASYIKLQGVDTVINLCENGEEIYPRRSYWRASKETLDTVTLHQFAKSIKPYIDKGIKNRAEGVHFSFFVEDRDTFNNLTTDLKKFVVNTWAPSSDEELEYLTSNNRKVIVEELPYGKFKHKIVFKTNWTHAKGQNFLNWMAKYPEDDYKISFSSLRYLSGSSRYCQDPFMYIAEPKMLTMLQLFAGDSIKYAEEFVPRSTLLL